MRVKRRPAKPYWEMTTEELAAATEEYDQEMAIDRFKPLSAESRALWEKACRKPGRPRRGQGSKVVSLSVERSLLARADDLAKNMGLTRAALIERGLKAVLAAEGRL